MDLIERIVTELEEPNRFIIAKIVEAVGEETAEDYLQQTLDLIAGGYEEAQPRSPLRRQDGEPRTKGGTFIYLIRKEVPQPYKRQLWPKKKKQKPPPQRLPWERTAQMLQELDQKRKGEGTVQIELTGVPKKFSSRGSVVSALFVVEPDEDEIPEGLPLPPSSSTYLVLMQSKDYQRVAQQIKEKGWQLQVRGYCHINTEKGIGTVLAQQVEAIKLVDDADDE